MGARDGGLSPQAAEHVAPTKLEFPAPEAPPSRAPKAAAHRTVIIEHGHVFHEGTLYAPGAELDLTLEDVALLELAGAISPKKK